MRKNNTYIRSGKNILLAVIAVLLCNPAKAQVIVSDSISNELHQVIAYGEQPRWKVTGAASSIKGDDLKKSFTTNVANTLNGRLPGLTIQQGSSEPGMDSPTFNGRGIGTFGGTTGLYFIIDGFPSTQTFFEQLTPEEIESVTLLKDAAATVMYGNKGANGVLLVTTKKGTEGKIKINFSAQVGFQQAARLPEFLDSYNYATLYNEALRNDGNLPIYTQADLQAYREGNDPLFHPNVDWYKELLRNVTPVGNYNMTARGGTNTIKYFVLFNAATSAGLYKKTEPVSEFTKNPGYSRYNFRTNVDIQLSRRLSATITLGGTVEDKTNPGKYEGTYEIFDLMASVAPNAFPVFVEPGMFGSNALYRKNPLAEITESGYISSNGRAAQTAAKLTQQLDMITPGLSISGAIGFNSYFRSYSKKMRDYASYSMSRDETGEIVFSQYNQDTSMSGDEDASTQWRNFVYQGSLDYERIVGMHDVNAKIMASYEDYTVTGSALPYKNVVLGGRFTYAYNQRYVAEFSFGYAGNDNYKRGNRFGFFPAGSLGWVLSNEQFLKQNPVIDFLKIRASYGVTGNTDIGNNRFKYTQYYDWGGNYYFGRDNTGSGIYKESTLANPEITWEKERKFNIGIEATLWNSLDFTFDYFKNNRSDILTKPYSTVPDYLGINLPDMNLGKVENKGFEISVRYTGNKEKEITWFGEVNAWYASNKVIFNAEEPHLYSYRYSTGHPVYQPFGLEAIGFFADQQDMDNSPRQIFQDVQPGDIKYKDLNGDNVIDQNDVHAIGNTSMPKLTMGFHTGVKYKGFDLDLFFQAAFKRSVYLDGKYYHAFQNDGKVSAIALDRWTPETASVAKYPRLSANNNQNNYQYSSFWQKNGNFLKLRSLEVGYTVPKQVTDRIRIEKVRVFLNGTNLFSIDHMNGMSDPEVMYGYPAVRTFSMGINVQL